ncbi:hypothetical protein ACQKPT_15400 [Pseudomonas monteilii]|uniref:hypothetical protein n=1 Tax=Pseudomonas monteilii TaxID=76759 RepID=UPI003D0951A9
MRRYDDIAELMEAVDSNLLALRAAYESAKHNEEQLSAARPVIKSILGDLRSILDYCAMSIFESYSRKEWRPYFPYGKNEIVFLKSIDKNLNGLATQSPDIFQLVLSLQPHICGSSWLTDLCEMTNHTKHRNLGIQKRINSPQGSVTVGNLFKVSGGSQIILDGAMIDGEVINDGAPVTLTDTSSEKEIKNIFGGIAEVSKSYDWVIFEMNDYPGDVLEFLKVSSSNVKDFVGMLNKIIDV